MYDRRHKNVHTRRIVFPLSAIFTNVRTKKPAAGMGCRSTMSVIMPGNGKITKSQHRKSQLSSWSSSSLCHACGQNSAIKNSLPELFVKRANLSRRTVARSRASLKRPRECSRPVLLSRHLLEHSDSMRMSESKRTSVVLEQRALVFLDFQSTTGNTTLSLAMILLHPRLRLSSLHPAFRRMTRITTGRNNLPRECRFANLQFTVPPVLPDFMGAPAFRLTFYLSLS